MNRPCVLVLAAAALLGPAAAALGNGGYFPPPAYPDIPKIPAQRAIVAFRDGVETLVVESAVETSSPSVGWILPLPAEPTKLGPADAGVLTSMAMCQRPDIVNESQHWIAPAVFLFLLIGPTLANVLTRDPKRRAFRVLLFLLLDLEMVVAATLVTPMFMTAGRSVGPTAGVEVRSMQRVGSYEAHVLKADDAGALDRWLGENELAPLNDRARGIVDGYIRDGFCFVVARIAKDDPQATPHPLAATFKTDRPIFPMRLTAVADSTTQVELFVIADQPASASRFTRTATGSYRYEKQAGGGDYYVSAAARLNVGHPDVLPLMWDGCAVTALQARLGPGDMDRDVELAFAPAAPFRREVYSPRARNLLIAAAALYGACALVLAANVFFRGLRRPKRRELWALALAVIVLAGVCGAMYVALPTVPVRELRYWGEQEAAALTSGLAWLDRKGEVPYPLTEKKLADFLPALLESSTPEEHRMNPLTGEPRRVERSPGNLSIRTIDGHPRLCYYDIDAREIILGPAGTPPPPHPSR